MVSSVSVKAIFFEISFVLVPVVEEVDAEAILFKEVSIKVMYPDITIVAK